MQKDENCYFIDAKRIRVTIRNKVTDVPEKIEVTVHVDCLKQLEKLHGIKSKKTQQKDGNAKGEFLKKRPLDPSH